MVNYLTKNKATVKGDYIEQVATISANNDKELGKIIAQAFKDVDETGVVMMETHEFPETVVEKVEGVQYERGFISPHFITNKENGTAELDNPLVLIVESPIENIRKIQSILEHVIDRESKAYRRSLLIIADVDNQVKTALAMNKVKANLKVNIVETPVYGVSKRTTLEDLAMLTGATIVNEELGDDMDLIQPNLLGECLKATSDANETILQIEDTPEEVEKVIESLKNKVKETKNPHLVTQHEKRIARLSAKVAIVKVGANSEVELREKRDRVEDAICATKAAIKEGIVPGGGIALLNASQHIKPKDVGEKVLLKAISSPYTTILDNAGITDYETPEVKGRGLDVVTGKTVSMVKSGIIDPLLVTKSALKNAASVATTILSTDCVINNVRA